MTLEPDARHVGVPRPGPRSADDHSVEADVAMQAPSVASSTTFQEDSDRKRRERRAGVPPQRPPDITEIYDPLIHVHGELDEKPDVRHVLKQGPRLADDHSVEIDVAMQAPSVASSTTFQEDSDRKRRERRAGVPPQRPPDITEIYDPLIHVHGELDEKPDVRHVLRQGPRPADDHSVEIDVAIPSPPQAEPYDPLIHGETDEEPDVRQVPRPGPRSADDHSVEADVPIPAPSVGSSTTYREDCDRKRRERRAGVPPQRPPDITEIYDPLIHVHGELDEEADDPAARAESTAAWWLDVLFSPVIFSITILFGAILLFMLLSEVFQFLQAVQSAPLLLRWLGYAFVVTLVAIASWAAIRLVLCCRKLRVTPQIQRSDYYAYAARHRSFVRKTAKLNPREGREILTAIVAEYPLKDPRFQKLLKSFGCTKERLTELRGDVQDLVGGEAGSTEAWLSTFDMRVLSVMDECANRCVRNYATQVGLKTALVPSSMADMLIVVTNSLLMLKDLCALYNVRTTPFATCSLAGHLFMNTFVAGQLEDQLKPLAEEAASAPENTLTSLAGDVGKVAATVTVGVGSRAAEGMVNFMFVRRLGTVCIKYLRPIQK